MEGSEDWFTRAMQMQTQTQMEMQTSSHVQRKRKEREIRKRKKYFSKMADNDWAFADSHVWEANANTGSRRWKCFYYLGWRLRLRLHLRWVVHTINSLHLQLRFAEVSWCDWLTEGGVGITLLGN